MNQTASVGTTHYTRVAGPGIEMPTAEVMKNVAFFRDLLVDPNAFVDKEDPTKRLPIKYVISTDNKAAPAGIATPHSFHIAFIESKAGNSPVIHAHEYREIFMPLKGRYRIYFNKNPEEFVELGPYDTFSVPPMLWRRVEQQGEKGEPGMVMVIYDNVVDPNKGIFVPQEVIDADHASGRDPYAKAAG
jgi:mannose-6-phosphate isomerase-like protein (cupin superfamily)